MWINLSFLLIACQNEAAENTLKGKNVTLEHSDGFEVLDEFEISLGFQEVAFQFDAGCNTHSGEYTLEDDVFQSSALVAATMIGCEEDLMHQDAWLSNFFTSFPNIDFDDITPTFSNENAIWVFIIENPE